MEGKKPTTEVSRGETVGEVGDDTLLNGDVSLVGVRPFQMSRLLSVTGKAVVSVDLCSGEGSVRVHGASACLHLSSGLPGAPSVSRNTVPPVIRNSF